jgi:hypothetical protein
MAESRYWPDCTTRAVRRDFQATPYFQALERAAYYRWKAQKRCALAGNDPLTGKPREHYCKRSFRVFVEESAVAHKAMARYWLEQARKIRLAAHLSLCDW